MIQTIDHPAVSGAGHVTAQRPHSNVIAAFLQWCAAQEKNRMFWLGLTFLGQIGLVLPCTLMSILFLGGNNFSLWLLACLINVPVLAIQLAAQPTRVTLPVLFFAWCADAAIILGCVLYFFVR